MSKLVTKYRVNPGQKIHMKDWKTNDCSDSNKEKAKAELEKLQERIVDLQAVLSAEHKHKVLIILQGLDTAGKDSTIRHVFEGVNPQVVDVSGFKAPTEEELDHDFLWRIHEKVPGKGKIMIFNRSHYEDVLAVRVHNLVPKEIWQKRFQHINNFEHLLSDEGTIILKFFLHIDRQEQEKRLRERLEDPKKNWKFSPNDVKERELWSEYMKAFEDIFEKTSTDWASWYIIPANTKWYRNLVISSVIVDVLEKLEMKYPKTKLSPQDIKKMIKKI